MDSLRVRDYMRKQPISFSPTTQVTAAVEALLKEKQLGGPVLDSNHRVMGWLSEQDCLASMVESTYYCESNATVSDVMSTEVLTIKPDMGIVDLAQLMTKNKPKIYPVLNDEGCLIGTISRRDVLAAIDSHVASCFAKASGHNAYR